MKLEFTPNINTISTVEFRPFMVEVAWNYCQLVLESTLQRGMITQTLAALAIEIILKSYNSVPVDNIGKINENYDFKVPTGIKLKNKHDLVALANLLPSDIRLYLIEPLDECILKENQNTFSNSRYYYEKSAPKSFSDSAMKLAIKLTCKTVYLYKQRGCNDPFITAFDVNAVFFTHVQRFVYVRGAI